eukprot:6196334-Pleurochrysis_carterae.AAC.7
MTSWRMCLCTASLASRRERMAARSSESTQIRSSRAFGDPEWKHAKNMCTSASSRYGLVRTYELSGLLRRASAGWPA